MSMKTSKRTMCLCGQIIAISALSILLLAAPSRSAADNLITNGNFSGTVLNGIPDGWRPWSDGSAGISSVIKDSNGAYACITKESNDRPWYLQQKIDTSKLHGKTLLLSARVSIDGIGNFKHTHSGGRLTILANNSVVKESVLREDVNWTKVVADPYVVPNNVDSITILIGAHSCSGKFSFKDVKLTPVELVVTKQIGSNVSEGTLGGEYVLIVNGTPFFKMDRKADSPLDAGLSSKYQGLGYIPFVRPNAGIFKDSVPCQKEVISSLSTFCTPGEYEPVDFAMYALRNLGQVTVEVSDFAGASGAILPGSIADIRTVKSIPLRGGYTSNSYYEGPGILEKKNGIDISKNQTGQYWLTLHVPEDAKPGDYKSTITIRAEGAATHKMALNLRVLPFKLVDDTYRAMFWCGLPEKDLKASLMDMVEHGINALCGHMPLKLTKDGNEPKIDLSESDKVISLYKSTGFTRPMTWAAGPDDWLSLRLAELYGIKLREIDFKTESDYPEVLKAPYKRTLQLIWEHAKKNNWPEIYFYLSDEPTCYPKRFVQALTEYRLAKEAVPEAKTFCTAYELKNEQKFGNNLDIRCDPFWYLCSSAQYNKDAVEDAKKNAKTLWGIGWPAMYDDFWSARKEGGYMPAKTGVEGAVWWVYYRPGDISDTYYDLRSRVHKRTKFSYTHEQQVVEVGSLSPTLSWEGLREGIDDWKYINTLKSCITKARSKGTKQAVAEADAAERELDGIMARIPWASFRYSKETDVFANSDANQSRKLIAERILKLRKVL